MYKQTTNWLIRQVFFVVVTGSKINLTIQMKILNGDGYEKIHVMDATSNSLTFIPFHKNEEKNNDEEME